MSKIDSVNTSIKKPETQVQVQIEGEQASTQSKVSTNAVKNETQTSGSTSYLSSIVFEEVLTS